MYVLVVAVLLVVVVVLLSLWLLLGERLFVMVRLRALCKGERGQV